MLPSKPKLHRNRIYSGTLRRLFALQLLAGIFANCKSELNVATVGSASLNPKAVLKSATNLGQQKRALYIVSLEQLPKCTSENDYQLVYVASAKQFMTCQATEWTVVNLDPTTASDAQIIVTTETEPSGANCASGGVRILTGKDNGADESTNAGDGQLTGAEVTKTNFVCRGDNGRDSLVTSIPEPAGSNCASGGLKIGSGLDDGSSGGIPNNQVLESGEIRSSTYVCNGATGSSGAAGQAGQAGLSSLVTTSVEPAGANCAYGGQEVAMGFDDGRAGGTSNNGLLETAEIRRITYLCNGVAGKTSLVAFLNEPAGSNCQNSGKKIVSGFDDGLNGGVANNNTLEESEIRTTAYLCNASATIGATGAAGLSSLVAVRPEAPGNNCSNGGQKILSGYDDGQGGETGNNGVLDGGEVRSIAYVCNGMAGAAGAAGVDGTAGAAGSNGFNSLVAVNPEATGVNCLNGGQKISTGLDNGQLGGTANNNILESGEIRNTAYVCGGAQGLAGATGATGASGVNSLLAVTAEAAGSNCTYGGQKVQSGLDDGRNGTTAENGVLDAGEVRSTAYLCNGATGLTGATGAAGATGSTGATGANGLNSLLAVSTEPSGGNCTAGGQKLSSGFDNGQGGGTAGNGVLESGEVRSVAYVCTGATGATGMTGATGATGAAGATGATGSSGYNALVSLAIEPSGANCPNGGQKFLTGIDNGQNGGIANNGMLDAGEVRNTSYLCSAASTAAGLPAAAFELAWLEGAAFNARTVTAAWTPSSVQASSFVQQTLTVYSDNLCQSQVGSASVLPTYGLSSSQVTLPNDGKFYFKIVTTMTGGVNITSGCERRGIVIDTTNPNAATALVWSAGSTSSSNSVNASWTKSTSPDLGDQDLIFYSGSSCNSVISTFSGLGVNAQSRVILTPSTGTYSFKIVSYDSLRNQSTSVCSGSIAITGTASLTLTGAPVGTSSATALNVTVSSTDTNFDQYAYAIVTNTAICPTGGYSSWYTSSTAITASLASLPDAQLTLCVISKDSSGNILPYASAASASWIKNTVVTGITVTPANQMVRMQWDPAGGSTIGYMVLRRASSSVSWTPTNGTSYVRSQADSNNYIAANITAGTVYNDVGLANGTTYFYQIYSYDAAANYTLINSVSAAPYSSVSICSLIAPPTTSSLCADPSNKTASQNFAGGAGTAASPYVICNAGQLHNVRNYLTSRYVIGSNIDLTSYSPWTPITGFSGTIDGGNFHITNLSINGSTNQGLFATTTVGATLQNLVMKSGSVTGTDTVGSLVGAAAGTKIFNVTNCVLVSGNNYLGGVVGEANGSSDLRSIFNAAGVSAAVSQAGGIAGRISSSLATNLSNAGVVSSVTSVGGVVGYAYNATMTTLINGGRVSAATNIGGVIGNGQGSSILRDGENFVDINTPTIDTVGGIAGLLDRCTNCSVMSLFTSINFGNITAHNNVGGVVGSSSGSSINTSKNYGVLNGLSNVGGIQGYLNSAGNDSTTDLCSNYGAINGTSNVGGILGGTSSNADANVKYASNSANITGLTSVGGIIGLGNDVGIDTATNSGNITGTGNYVGGLYGQQARYDSSFSIVNGNNSGTVQGYDSVGGIAGYVNYGARLTNLTNTASGRVIGQNNVGGVVGSTCGNCDITASTLSNAGAISGASNVGGVIGLSSDLFLSTASNTGGVTGTGDYVGGIFGQAQRHDNVQSFISLTNTAPITGGNQVGGIAGAIGYGSTLSSCSNSASGTITGLDYTGGIVGRLPDNSESTISSNTNYATVSGRSYVGGILGYVTDGDFNANTNYGSISGTGNYAAGIAGVANKWDSNSITNVGNVNNGDVSGVNYVAGIDGQSTGQDLSNNTNHGNISGNNYVAGISAFTNDNAHLAFTFLTNSGNISGASYVAGLVSYASDMESASELHNSGNLTATGSYCGGLLAYYRRWDDQKPTFSNSDNSGNISGSSIVGGLFGYINGSILTNVRNTGQIRSDQVTWSTSYVGGIAGQMDSVATNSVANAGNVFGKQFAGGIAGSINNSFNWVITVQDVANRGIVSALTDAGGLFGVIPLNYTLTLLHGINITNFATSNCTANCGAIAGSTTGPAMTVSAVYSVAQTGSVTNSVGTKVNMAMTDFQSAANFIAAPPLSGSPFNPNTWGYTLNANGSSGMTWLAGMP